jgi:S-adenosylmethionine:tRNA ribosyltransferase-isomerase
MRIDLFDYSLPHELIAQEPAPRREDSRLLVLDRASGRREHRRFAELPNLLRAGDVLVLNDTKVLPARLRGRREKTGGQWEGLFLAESGDVWEMLTKTRGRLQPAERITIADGRVILEFIDRPASGSARFRLVEPAGASAMSLLEEFGEMPLPPYIRGGKALASDRERYQTTYAEHVGSVAAPTAGLHFTPEMLQDLGKSGVGIERITLHVGIGTFLPVKVEDTANHVMHAEWCDVPATVATRLNQAKAAGRRIVAVGTTTVRTLESAAREAGPGNAFSGPTRLFVAPPFEFRVVDVLVTNFHLPRSTLLMLVAAFAGRELILDAYADAIRERYRFFSYGDAMLIQ